MIEHGFNIINGLIILGTFSAGALIMLVMRLFVKKEDRAGSGIGAMLLILMGLFWFIVCLPRGG